MRFKKRKFFAFLLAAAMLIANISALTFASADTGTKTAAENDSTRAAAPTASIKAGTYKDTQKVSLATSTKEAVIYYTTDGKAPTNKSKKFDSKKPIEIEKTTTVKAIAVKAGLKDSPVASFTYTISATAEATVTATPTATAGATVTPTATTAAEATIAPAAEPTATAAPTVKPADEPAPADDPAATDETMKLTVNYEGTISVGETTVTDLMAAANLMNYKPEGENAETEIPYEIKSVTWSQSTADTTPTSSATPETAGKIMAGEEYTVKIALGVKAGATVGTTVPEVTEVTFLGAALKENPAGSNIFEGTVEVPDLKITPTPASGGKAKAESTIKLMPSVTGATFTYSIDDGKTYQDYSSSGVPVSGNVDDSFSVIVRGKIAPYEYPETSFNYTIVDPIGYVDIYGLTLQGYNKKPLKKKDIKVESTDGEVVLQSVTWATGKDGSGKIGNNTKLKANTTYYGFIRMTAGEGYEFDTDVFTKNDGDGIWVYKSADSSSDLNDTFKPIVYKISEDSLTVRVTNETKGSSAAPTTPTQRLDPAKNSITGVYENTSYTVRTSRTFTATGVSNSTERYVPYEYYFNGTTVKMQDSNRSAADYSTSLSKTITMPSSSGTYELRVTFYRQTYNSSRKAWENASSNLTYVKTVKLRVVPSTSSTSSSSSASTRSSSMNSSTSSKSSGAKTGDQTPIGMYVGLLLIAAVAIGGVLVYRKKTNKK